MKWIIEWNAGFGMNYEIIEADTESAAHMEAHVSWLEDVETNYEYGVAGKYTKELAIDLGLEE